jgi:hypothetical protein
VRYKVFLWFQELKMTVPRDFSLQVFFHESSSPKPLIISLASFQILFENSIGIRSSRCTTGVFDTGSKWKKTSIRKFFNIVTDATLTPNPDY